MEGIEVKETDTRRISNKYKHLMYLKSAADAGHAACAGKIGIMYLSGKGRDKDQRDNAKKYLSLAFEEGDDSILRQVRFPTCQSIP